MHLSPAQLATLKAAIDADPTMSAFPMSADGFIDLANYLNQASSPDYWVIRTSVSQLDFQSRPSAEGTNFDWAQAGGFIARNQGERDALRTMFQPGSVNPSFATVRSGWDDMFSGAGVGAIAIRAHWRVIARRKATRFERIFAVVSSAPYGIANPVGTSVGARGTTTNPDTLGTADSAGTFVESPISAQRVEEARSLP